MGGGGGGVGVEPVEPCDYMKAIYRNIHCIPSMQ